MNWGPYVMLGSPLVIKTPAFSVQDSDGACPADAEVMDFTKLRGAAAP